MLYRYIGDFYLKGLNPELKYDIWQDIKCNITKLDRRYILDKKNNYANVYSEPWGLIKNEDDMNRFIAFRLDALATCVKDLPEFVLVHLIFLGSLFADLAFDFGH